MQELTNSAPPPVLPVIVLHEAAEALIAADAPTTAERIEDCRGLLATALAVRATSTDELVYRFSLLRETLAREDGSDFSIALLDAIAQDVAAILTARRG